MNVQTRPPLDPVRSAIETRARTLGIKMVAIGPAIGRSRSYMHSYLRRQDPVLLPVELRPLLAKVLRMPETDLCPPDEMASVATPEPQDSRFADTIGRMLHPPVVAGTHSVPLFAEDAAINPEQAQEWVPSPSNVPVVGGMFALLIQTVTPRARPGDTVFVANRRPRVGDMAVALLDGRVVAVGELLELDAEEAVFALAKGPKGIALDTHRILKVTTIATA